MNIKLPVLIKSALPPTQNGTSIPINREKPMMAKLRAEFKSTYWRFDSPTAMIIPVQKYVIQ